MTTHDADSDWQRVCYDDVAGQLAEARDEADRLRGISDLLAEALTEARKYTSACGLEYIDDALVAHRAIQDATA